MAEPVTYVARDGDVSQEVIGKLAESIGAGGVVILPTDTIYGLHCDAMNERAVSSIFQLKLREKKKPLIVLASSIGQLTELGVELNQDVESWLASIWPAPLTAILPLRKPIPASAGTGTIAARIPSVPWLQDLAGRVGPLASTSVNVSGRPAIYNTESVEARIRKSVAAVLDSGPLSGEPSTVVDFTSGEPRMVREGKFRFTQDLWKTSRKSL
ncbi:MAG TPA: L-threonylcarbamoyladenylate synthase [Thermoanaerobaculia bacterium]|nr:L-threonylcarbamoyladenylate synthase [Thermoanaerobaculia bacterium]